MTTETREAMVRRLTLVKEERFVVVETGPGYEVVADFPDDPPAHTHFDIFDSTAECPRCLFDNERAEG